MDIQVRNFREDDLSGAAAASGAGMRADRETLILGETELRGRLTDPRLDPARDLWVAESSGKIVAFGYGLLRRDGNSGNYLTRGYVHPDYRRQGIGTRILQKQWERLGEIANREPGLTLAMAARVQETQVGAVALLNLAKFRPVRYFYEMENRLTLPPKVNALPESLALVRWSALRSDQAVWAAVNEAFADHWGFVAETFDSFEHRVDTGVFDPQASVLAVDGGEIAGGALCQMGAYARERFQRNMGYLEMLFVRRAWRRRGVGEALLRSAIQNAREYGHASLRLTVDTENPTGAMRIYEKTGFDPVKMSILYQKRYNG